MAGSELKIISLNAHRIGRREKLVELREKILEKNPHVVYIQEIVVNAAIRVFNASFQVVINMEERAINGDGVGIVTLIKNGINISDFIIGAEGRTIGIKINNAQFWNIYPLSGTNNKTWRGRGRPILGRRFQIIWPTGRTRHFLSIREEIIIV